MRAERVVALARALRVQGVPVGPDRVLTALAALEALDAAETPGPVRRDDVHAALCAVLLQGREQQAMLDAAFEQAFGLPGDTAAPPAGSPADVTPAADPAPDPAADPAADPAPAAHPPGATASAATGFSSEEHLRQADFSRMSPADFARAVQRALALPPLELPVATRRRQGAARGRVDLRRTLQRMARQPLAPAPALAFTQPRREPPPCVVLLDVSGSMERYARLFLHYAQGLMRQHARLQVFAFATRLTDLTRALRRRDPELALALAAEQLQDWRGGTRIGACLDAFNRQRSSRVPGADATVLLVTDGLDRGDTQLLSAAAARLARRARCLVWLNPLLRFDGYAPLARGATQLHRHAHGMLAVHNLEKLEDLASGIAAVLRR